MYSYYCNICGTLDTYSRNNAKVCTEECRMIRANLKTRKKDIDKEWHCIICNTLYSPADHNQLTCSDACRYARWKLVNPPAGTKYDKEVSESDSEIATIRIKEVLGEIKRGSSMLKKILSGKQKYKLELEIDAEPEEPTPDDDSKK